jgi:hypothetical protein
VNQDQVKQQLLQLEEEIEDFSLIFSGKSSKKANGVYYPDTREIIIHNRNFKDDNALIYTAIHEFAHHVHFTRSSVPIGSKAHTMEFRRQLHELLERAEEKGIYRNVFQTSPDFQALTYRIRRDFLSPNGQLMKDFGSVLMEAEELCQQHNARFEDYVERVLSMDYRVARTLMKMHTLDVNPQIGYENMRTVANISNPDTRQQAEEAFAEGKSPDYVKTMVKGDKQQEQEDPQKELMKEKRRIERTINSLQEKLREIEDRLERIDVYGTEEEGESAG